MAGTNPTYRIDDGVHCADFIGRDQNINHYGFDAEDVERLIEKVLVFLQAGAVFLPLADQPDTLQIEHEGQKLVFHPGAARQLAGQRSPRAYLLALTVDQEYQRWATRFVPLAGKMDLRQVIDGIPICFTEMIIPSGEGGIIAQPVKRPLENIAEAMNCHPAFVILGEPGAGKTTTQQRIAYDAARTLLEGGRSRAPLFLRLSQQGERDPYAFLENEWERRTGIAFAEALAAGQILILADGINEIPRQKRSQRLKDWMLFEQQYRGANQLIFSGREKEYDDQLNLPRVIVQPLDDTRIADFLKRHNAEALADLLDDPASRLREMARNPLNLFVLVMVYLQGGKNLQVLANRGKLFQSFTHYLLKHEQDWHPDALSADAKVDLLSTLAYAMQQQGSGTTFELLKAKKAVPDRVLVLGEQVLVDKDALLRFGRGASILDPATLPDVRFYHHLLQEYFAARELLRRFNSGEDLSAFWKTPRTVDAMPPAGVGEWDPLPEPPTSGWEVTTILACGLARDPARLIEAVRAANSALAGRCLDEAGIDRPTDALSAVRKDLLADLYDPKIHLRARLQAGHVLGRIGDPRFQAQEINGVRVVLPQMVQAPAGKYTIGSRGDDPQAYDDEKPSCFIELPAFSIGRWPVTNAEFACFMEAGGYAKEDFWQGDLDRRWLKGEDVAGGQFSNVLEQWKIIQTLDDVRKTLEESGSFTPGQIDTYEYISKLSEEELKTWLSEGLQEKSRSRPAFWDDPQVNNPSHPVVGVTWFEARAYCAWLSALTGRIYRLPGEAEWEAAAHGYEGRVSGGVRDYPWGDDWDPAKANTIEGRVLHPSPVGAYAAAAQSPYGAEDQAGNVWEWTSSLFLPYPYDPAKSEQAHSEGKRVVRGGSWNDNRRDVRCASRGRDVPDGFLNNLGFRLVSPA